MKWDIWDNLFDKFESEFESMFQEQYNNSWTSGYSMYRGPDGVTHVKEFGSPGVWSKPSLTKAGGFEPITDVTIDKGEVCVTVELPGVKKEDIILEENGNSLRIAVDDGNKYIDRSVKLPCNVIAGSAKAEYNNGILEVKLKSDTTHGRRIDIS